MLGLLYMRKKLLFVLLTIVLGGASFWYFTHRPPTVVAMPVVTATIAGTQFRLHAPQTEQAHETGLAAFKHIADNEGMLLRGMPVGTQSIWMKNMQFDIDVLWINQDNQIVYIVQGMSKSDQQTIYHNPYNLPSAYVIELAAESCNKYSIAVGQTVTIEN